MKTKHAVQDKCGKGCTRFPCSLCMLTHGRTLRPCASILHKKQNTQWKISVGMEEICVQGRTRFPTVKHARGKGRLLQFMHTDTRQHCVLVDTLAAYSSSKTLQNVAAFGGLLPLPL